MEIEKISGSIKGYLTTVARDLRESRNGSEKKDPALLARHIAVGELLIEISLNSGQSSAQISHLSQFTQLLREAFDLSGIEVKEGRLLLSLFRSVVRASFEKAENDGEQLSARVALLVKVGTHADSLDTYLECLNELFNKEELKKVRDYFPDGEQFIAIQRQRSRWGNQPLIPLAA